MCFDSAFRLTLRHCYDRSILMEVADPTKVISDSTKAVVVDATVTVDYPVVLDSTAIVGCPEVVVWTCNTSLDVHIFHNYGILLAFLAVVIMPRCPRGPLVVLVLTVHLKFSSSPGMFLLWSRTKIPNKGINFFIRAGRSIWGINSQRPIVPKRLIAGVLTRVDPYAPCSWHLCHQCPLCSVSVLPCSQFS